MFQERLQDAGDTPVSCARRTFHELDLRPEIIRAADKLFQDGHYAQAVDAACKVLVSMVGMRSGKDELNGTDLMQTVFSPNNPILRFSALSNQSEQDEQKGMMLLYAVGMLALRNPRAHEPIVDTPERAVSYLAFLSMLVKELDRVKSH